MSLENTRAERLRLCFDPNALDRFEVNHGAWFEPPEEIARGLRQGQRKAVLLAWVRAQMLLVLTPREQQCLELYYFQGGMTYEAIGRRTGTHASSCCRAVHRALRKLRAAKERDESWKCALARIGDD